MRSCDSCHYRAIARTYIKEAAGLEGAGTHLVDVTGVEGGYVMIEEGGGVRIVVVSGDSGSIPPLWW